MANQIAAEQLWQFSLTLYPKIKQTCLLWQDNYNANVNLLLFLCYLEQNQQYITAPQLNQLAKSLLTFNTAFTQPIRALRRQAPAQLKQALLDAELVAEQIEQQQLCRDCSSLQQGNMTLLESYLQLLEVPLSGALQQQLFDLRQHL